MQPAVRIENLSKLYRIGARQNAHYRTLRETLMDAAAAPWRRIKEIHNHSRIAKHELNGQAGHVHSGQAATGHAATSGRPVSGVLSPVPVTAPPDSIWALNDVSFDVQHGEVVGIIGRNGAGKSTLLKVLSRITEPTKGRVVINGRVASLLEVGTGFHPELTGRENIYLNGAILGMHRHEIKRKFDAIVDFSGVETFIDTPVKRYSSGMQVRLAFAVAAHLDPEILIVDEVLAVGDAVFQRRCIDHMSKIASSGRTVLFVSHNMDLIPRLCRHAVLLYRGQIVDQGPAERIASEYLASSSQPESTSLADRPRSGDGRARFTAIELLDRKGNPVGVHRSGDDLIVRVQIESSADVCDVDLAMNLKTPSGIRLHSAWTRELGREVKLSAGLQAFTCQFESIRIRPGRTFVIELWMNAHGVMDWVQDAFVVQVVDGDNTSDYSSDRSQGEVLVGYDWIAETAYR